VSVQPDTDVLGAPYTVETIALTPDDEGAVECNLVRLTTDSPSGRAVLYVHGFSDYFFQKEFAQWWADRGYDFYALDLRKYGRSLREHQTPNYVADVHDYFEDLDAAWQRVVERDGHDRVILAAHSTGGLVVSLWADARQPALTELRGMVLNSPWLDMQGPFWIRNVGTVAIRSIGRSRPMREIPRVINTFYGQSLHVEHGGEWAYDLAWKPLDSWPIYFGWLRAIRRAHAELHRGLDVGTPVLVLSSGGTRFPKQMSEEVHGFDIVLDVAQIRRWTPALGRHVTIATIEGALHDVILSRPEIRARAYDEIERWVAAYVETRAEPAVLADDV
jgi:alpha-beta hydrolase superfamily lysophospholipase